MIAFDATSNSGYQAASASYSWSHTCGGAYRCLIVSVAMLNVANEVATLTYAGVSMTKLRSDVDGTGTIRTDIYYLVNPTLGTNSVAITLNSASVSASSASSYAGVDQDNPVDAQNGTTGTTGAGGGSSSLSMTTISTGAWIIDAMATTDTSITAASGQTSRNNVTGAVGSGGQSDKALLMSPGTTTMAWDNIGALLNWTMSAIALKPFTMGTTTSSTSMSSTSSSISTTSMSTSSTSTSVSTTSVSTSSTSSSLSTSSTSSSISSTSSSTSSTSVSSTSASTSLSSTSSSISSTSFSSTSQSSTSSSTSMSSTSSSFSSTSSSISSTSASTSSTSVSSTSSSSSTSTTAIELKRDYSYEDETALTTSNPDLTNLFTSPQLADVSADDGDYFIEYGSEYIVREYKYKHTNNADSIVFTWSGRSTLPTTVSPILIQVYNYTSTTWETFARETRVLADVDLTVQIKITANLSNYYDSNNIVSVRSYQQVI